MKTGVVFAGFGVEGALEIVLEVRGGVPLYARLTPAGVAVEVLEDGVGEAVAEQNAGVLALCVSPV